MIYQFSFEKLIVWQKSKELVIWSYQVTNKLPESERFGLFSQVNRAVISVSANIAEGNSKKTNKEKLRYIDIAYGSLMEVLSHYYIIFELNFIQEETFDTLKSKVVEVAKLLNGLKKSLSI